MRWRKEVGGEEIANWRALCGVCPPRGRNLVADGTGTLKFNVQGQTNPEAVLHLADSGKIEIPEGVTIRVAAVDLGGETITEGAFTKNDGTDVGGHIEGASTLKIGRRGMLLIVQ